MKKRVPGCLGCIEEQQQHAKLGFGFKKGSVFGSAICRHQNFHTRGMVTGTAKCMLVRDAQKENTVEKHARNEPLERETCSCAVVNHFSWLFHIASYSTYPSVLGGFL